MFNFLFHKYLFSFNSESSNLSGSVCGNKTFWIPTKYLLAENEF